MKEKYEFLYFIIIRLYVEWEDDKVTSFTAVLLISLFQFFWVLNLYLLWFIFFPNHDFIESINEIIVGFFMVFLGLLNGFYFLKNRYFLKVIEKFEGRKNLKELKRMFFLILSVTIISTIFLMVLEINLQV